MSFIQKTFPQELMESAKKIETAYFVDHVNQTDYFAKGYEAVPALFKFCFDKKVYEEVFKNLDKVIADFEEKIQGEKNSIAEVSADPEIDKAEKNFIINQIKANIDSIIAQMDLYVKLKKFKESDFNEFDLSMNTSGFAMFLYNEANYSKPVNALLYKFIDQENESTQDYVQIISKRNFEDLIKAMMAKGFVYDKDNCLFGKVVQNQGLIEESISDEHVDKLKLIDTLAEFVRANNHFEYVHYVEEQGLSPENIFDNNSLLAYAIATDKNDFALSLIVSDPEATLNVRGEFNDVLEKSMYSIIYRNHKFTDYLDRIINRVNFSNKDQSYVDKFVKLTYEPLKKTLSKEIFEILKSKIDKKMLSLALVRDSSVYRLENEKMAGMIKEAFELYPDEIMASENIVSHFSYYAKSMDMLDNLSKTPDIMIAGHPAATFVERYIYSVKDRVAAIKETGETKYDFWEEDSELRTEEEFLLLKLQKLEEIAQIFGINIEEDEEVALNVESIEFEDSVDDEESPNAKYHGEKAEDYVFSVYKKTMEESGLLFDTLKGVIVYITPKAYWEENGYLNDQPDYTPRKFLPKEWQADDINESGTWFMVTEESFADVEQRMISLGFTFDQKFDEFVNDF